MDKHRFDMIARAQIGASSRRQALKLLIGGILGPALAHMGRANAVASCGAPFNQRCGGNTPCCAEAGLRCKDRRCRCKKDWEHCKPGPACQHLKRDPDHCGTCGKKCPTNKPCCINGECRALCNGECCGDCFVTVTGDDIEPDPDSAICCQAANGKVCSKKSGEGEDRCCYPEEKCLKGQCCRDGEYGETNCAGTCCRESACCNDKTCCKQGHVCATKTEGSGKQSCVPANRSCNGGGANCYPGEECHGGKCCSGVRLCKDAGGSDHCCKAGEYCEFPDAPNAHCVPVHTSDSTYRSHRIRP
ncbi:MAG: hypothetical protein M3464_16495 [Chloroflexota bacterium]|nr:hypothetical protein [Chloroflexota bacterium]